MRTLHLFVLPVALCHCTLIPDYVRPAAPVAARFPDTSGVSNRQAASLPWRKFFAEARLEKLITLALANNRDLRVAALKVEKSQAQYRITRAASFPTLDGGLSYSRSHLAGTTREEWQANHGSAAYEVDLFGKIRSLNEQSLQTYFATAEAQRSAQLSLVAEVASQYFFIRKTEELLQLSQQTLTAVQGLYELNQARLDAGESNELDLRTAEGQVQTARINILTYERQVAQGYNALVLLIGASIPSHLSPARPLATSGLLASIPAGLPSDLLQVRPDIRQAERSLLAANANIGAARAAFFPSITLTSSAGATSAEFSNLLDSARGTWSFSPKINLPIFNGGQLQANLDVAKVSTRIEVANYEKSIQLAFREVADALVATNNYAQQVTAQAALSESQQRRFDLANARFLSGEDSYLSVLSAQQDLYNAQQGRIDALYNSLASRISLYKALGGGWAE